MNKKFFTEEDLAMILGKMRDVAAGYLGEEVKDVDYRSSLF